MDGARLEALDLNQQGVLLLGNENYEAAKEKFEKAIEIDPMVVDSYKNLGDYYMALDEYNDAKNSYKKALLIEKNGLFYFLYGNACFMNDELHEGLENYNMALTCGYDTDEMMFFMGMAYEHMNDDQMALRYYQKACLKNPSRPDFQIKKIATLLRLNMLNAAEETVEQLLRISPELFDGYHIKTLLLIKKKELAEARKFAKSASERFPDDVELMYDYVKCVALTGDFAEACKLLEVAKQMNYFVDAKYKFTLLEAQIAAEAGEVEKAIRCCEECNSMEEGTENQEARFMLMNLHMAMPAWEKVLECANEIIAKEQKDSYYYAALYYKPFSLKQMGQVEEAMNHFKEANVFFRTATLKNPAALDIYLYRAMCLKDLEQYDKALELLDFIEGIKNDMAEVHVLRSEIYRILGQESKAKAEAEIAYRMKPELRGTEKKAGE